MLFPFVFFYFSSVLSSNIPPPRSGHTVYVQKCCKKSEIFVDNNCSLANETDETPWTPTFQDNEGQLVYPHYSLLTEIPACGNRQPQAVYHKDTDRLTLLPDGTLRHYTITHDQNILDIDLNDEILHYDYQFGFYCREKKIDKSTGSVFQYAIVCPPDVSKSWKDMDFVLRKIVDPIFHVIAIMCYITIAIVHFVLPQLRDMVGNIITTMCICLVIAKAADIFRIFTEFTSPLGFLIAEIVMFISLMGAYFWLNSLGFYIWRTFRSQNVFLRMTDGKKYCYYSYWVWGWTIVLSVFATFSHFAFDVEQSPEKPIAPVVHGTALGWLGVNVFFLPIACTVLANIYFYLSTSRIMNTVARYGGRIHHKLKYCFETFLKIFIIMAVSLLFLALSWIQYSGLYYCYIFITALEAPIILYISVLSQRRVCFLLRKVCCFEKCVCHCFRPNQPNDIPEWGEEMMAMNR